MYIYYSSSQIATKYEENNNPSSYVAFYSLKCLKQIGFIDIQALILAENANAKL